MSDDPRAVQEKEKQVDSLLSRSNHFEALKTALHNPPLGSKNQQIKDQCTAIVMKAMASPSEGKIKEIVEKLYGTDPVLLDNLMKYVYRGLSEGAFSGNLLKWHAQVVDTAGLGTIVRTMTDRKTV